MIRFVRLLCTTLLLLAMWMPARAQDVSDAGLYAPDSAPEKCFVHTDRSVYAPGEQIWLRGYLVNSDGAEDTQLSNYLYVELLSDTLVLRIMLKWDGYGFSGFLSLPSDIAEGSYILRAYTRWMFHWPAEYMFCTRVIVTEEIGAEYVYLPEEKSGPALTFYPESGHYLENRATVMAFQTRSPYAEGVLYNDLGEAVLSFRSDAHGLGWFRFAPQTGRSYTAKLSGSEQDFSLPDAAAFGASISLSRSAGALIVAACLRPQPVSGAAPQAALEAAAPASVFLRVHNGSEVYYEAALEGSAIQYEKLVAFRPEELTSGVHCALLVNARGETLAARPFYVEHPQDVIGVEIGIDSSALAARNSIAANIFLKDAEGRPIEGNFSVSVTDPSTCMPETAMAPYFRLWSELASAPSLRPFYFNTEVPLTQRLQDIDALIMVYGWAYADFSPTLGADKSNALMKKELSQSIRGRVSGFMTKNPKAYTLAVFAPDLGFYESRTIRRKGSFVVDSLDFPEGTQFVLQTSSGSKWTRVIPEWLPEPYPDYHDYQPAYGERTWKRKPPGPEASAAIARKKAEAEALRIADSLEREGAIRLKEAVVTADFQNNGVISPLGQKFEPRSIKGRKDLQLYDFMAVEAYILAHFPSFYASGGFMMSRKSASSKLVPQPDGSMLAVISHNPAPVYIDGMKYADPELDKMYVRELESIVVLRGAEGALFNSVGNVIILTTRRGGNRGGDAAQENPEIIGIEPLGWQLPKAFIPTENAATLYWNPVVITDIQGHARIEFHRGESVRPLVLRIEGLTTDGRPVSKLVPIR